MALLLLLLLLMQAPSGMSRADFKEVCASHAPARSAAILAQARPDGRRLTKGCGSSLQWKRLQQEKAKFRLGELEERLKRLQQLESR